MAFCEEPALTYLNEIGYNVVRLPRSDLAPLDILGQEEKRRPERLGALPKVWTSAAKVPPVTSGDTANVSGRTTSAIKVSLGMKILENVLSSMGAAIPQLNLAYSRARSVRFEFRDPEIKTVTLFDVGNYLAKGDLATENPIVRHYMLEDDTSAYVIYEVLQSKAIRVSALDEQEMDAAVNVEAVNGAMGANVEAKLTEGSKGDLVYHGKNPLVFGYKAQEIVYSGTEWSVRRQELFGAGAMNIAEKREFAPPTLFQGAGFLGPRSRS